MRESTSPSPPSQDQSANLTDWERRQLAAEGITVTEAEITALVTGRPPEGASTPPAPPPPDAEAQAVLEERNAVESAQYRLGRLATKDLDGASLAAELADITHSLQAGGADALTIRRPSELLAMTFDDSDCLLGDRLLATGQSLVVAGPGGIGKSRLLLQLAVCQITGRDFVGIETHGAGKRWLILQAENSNRRLQFDLKKLAEWTGPEAWQQVNELLTIHTVETDMDALLALDDGGTVRRLERVIDESKPDVVACDALYNFAAGDLDRDADMRATLQCLSRLVRRGNPGRALVVLHHALTGRAGAARATGFDRASYGRNSKVLHAWTRAQINVAPGMAGSNDVLVLSCGKNNNGKEFEPFAIRLNPATMLYAPEPGFDLAAWQADVSGKPDRDGPLMTPERVRELCLGPMSKAELAAAIGNDCGCCRMTAYRHIDRAVAKRRIKWNPRGEHYLCA